MKKKLYWQSTWNEIEKSLTNLEYFRKSYILTRAESKTPIINQFLPRCEKRNILPEYYSDTLIGHPVETANRNGVVVTGNSVRHAYFVDKILEKATFTPPITVLEVGSGYGGFIEQLSRRIALRKCYLLDGSLTEAGLGDIIEFTAPREMVDLIITTNTLGEMVPEDVREYIKLFEAVLKPETGLFYSIQRKKDNSPHGQ
jgi:hypothetical protein